MKWRQCVKSGTLVPIDESARGYGLVGHAIHGDIESFVSPVDGSVISDRKQLREHNKRNGVVNVQEFDQTFFERKAEERARFYTGEHTPAESRARKQEIYDIIMRQEREG